MGVMMNKPEADYKVEICEDGDTKVSGKVELCVGDKPVATIYISDTDTAEDIVLKINREIKKRKPDGVVSFVVGDIDSDNE
jgi:hypothetical protein